MTPLARVAWGFLVVVVDIRLEGLDVVADPVGWVLVLSGLVRLARHSPWLTAATVAAAVGTLLSVTQLFGEPGDVLGALHSVAELVFVFGTCTGIMRLVDGRPRTAANRIRWADLGVTAGAVALGLVASDGGRVSGQVQATGGAAVVLLLLVLAALAVAAWFAIFLLGVQHHPALGGRQRLPA